MTITEKQLAERVTAVYHEGSDLETIMQNIARTAAELLGVDLAPEPKPLPTEPGSVIIATEVRGVKGKWRMFCDPNGDWFSVEEIANREWHEPEHITAWAEARVVPVAATPVTLTEDQVGELWDANKSLPHRRWAAVAAPARSSITAAVNAALAQHAAPAEGEPIASAAKPIDLADVLEGDRVRLELDNGDEATITVTRVAPDFLTSERYVFYAREIRSVRLLHREEA